MRAGGKKVLSWIAIYAVALHVILLGLAPITVSAAPADPLLVICHSQSDAAPEAPNPSGSTPGHACEHCTLCGNVAPPPPPTDVLAIVVLAAGVLDVLLPTSAPVLSGTTATPNLARGPPSFV